MLNLVLKDLLIQKKYLLISILYAFFLTFVFKSNTSILFGTAPIMISYMLLIGACGFDDKNKCEIMLNSLPIDRITLVISKYISAFVFMILGLFFAFIATTLVSLSGAIHFNRQINLEDILTNTIALSIFTSIYFPIHFKFGYQKTRYFLVAIFCFIFAAPSFLNEALAKHNIVANYMTFFAAQPEWILLSLIIIATLILFIISLLFSIRFYTNRDL